ncbi:MAG: VanZ family protein [Ignavibacteriae bacterium]|nr:VanZ family protein [Ignavibacteriota bacterium]
MTVAEGGQSFTRYQLPVLLWALIIFVTSSIPSDELPKLDIFRFDKLIHSVVFFVFCALTHRAIRFQDKLPRLAKHQLVFSVVITVIYGLLDEIHQYFVPGRQSSVIDLSADALGGLLYVGLVWLRERSH